MTKAIVGASTVLLVAGVAMGIFVDRQFLAKSPATGQTTEAKLPSTTVSNPPAPSVRSKPAPRIVREAGPAQIADTMTLAEARAALAVADTELDQSRRFEGNQQNCAGAVALGFSGRAGMTSLVRSADTKMMLTRALRSVGGRWMPHRPSNTRRRCPTPQLGCRLFRRCLRRGRLRPSTRRSRGCSNAGRSAAE